MMNANPMPAQTESLPPLPGGQESTGIENGLALRRRIAESNAKLQAAGWLIDAMEDLAREEDFGDACRRLVASLLNHLAASHVVFVSVRTRKPDGTASDTIVEAVSQQPIVDRNSEIANQYRLAGLDAIRNDVELSGISDASSSYSFRELRKQCGPFLAIPFSTDDGVDIGVALVFLARAGSVENASTKAFASAICSPIASILWQHQRCAGGRLNKLLRRLSSVPWSTKIVTVLVVAAAIVLMFMPVTHRVSGSVTLQPVRRVYAVAPFDGIVDQVAVRPGDPVRQGQLLATMDDRELRLKSIELSAKRSQLVQDQQRQLIDANAAEAMALGLEIDQVAAQILLVKAKLSSVQILASQDGIALASSVEDRENAPVRIGDALFEVASTDKLRADILVATEDVSFITPGQVISISFFGLKNLLGSDMEAVVEQILPEAVSEKGHHGFLIRCGLDNSDARLQVGMTGHAKIHVGRAALGWVLFHSAIDRLMVWL